MKVPNSVVLAIKCGDDGDCGSSADFFCEESVREEAANCLVKTFFEEYAREADILEDDMEEWISTALQSEEPEFGEMPDCWVSLTENGFTARFNVVEEDMGAGPIVWDHLLEKAIQKLVEKYPEIHYSGMVCYFNQDGAEELEDAVVQYTFNKGMDIPEICAGVGEKLSDSLDDEEFWEILAKWLRDESEFADVLAFFQGYAEYIKEDSVERLLTLAEEKSPAIRKALEGESF